MPGTRSMSPKEQRIVPGPAGDLDRLVDIVDRRDADRAAGAVDQRDVRRQQLVDAVADDGVGLAAADLHQRPGPRGDAARSRAAKRRAASGSRYSSRNFMRAASAGPSSASMSPIAREMLEDAAGLGLVDDGDGEADMDEHVVADRGFRACRRG